MDPSIEPLLFLVAEVSIATVALSGITMFLAASNMKLDIQSASLITTQLRMAFAVTLFSIFPLFLVQFELEESGFWRTASLLYLAMVIYLWLQGGLLARGEARRLKPPKLAAITGVSAIILLGFNIWHASAWPYLAQLFLAWFSSMFLYLGFIQTALDHKVEADKQTD